MSMHLKLALIHGHPSAEKYSSQQTGLGYFFTEMLAGRMNFV